MNSPRSVPTGPVPRLPQSTATTSSSSRPGRFDGRRVAVLGHLRQRVQLVEEYAAPAPEVVGDVRDRRPRQRRPAAAALGAGQPVAQHAVREPRVGAEVGAGEPAERDGGEQPAVGGVLDPVLDQRDPLVVLLDRGQPRRPQPGAPVELEPGGDDVRGAPPVGEVRRVAQLGRVAVLGAREPLDDDRPAAEHGPPDAGGGRAGATGQRVPPRLGLPHGPDASRCRGSGSATTRQPAHTAASAVRVSAGGRGEGLDRHRGEVLVRRQPGHPAGQVEQRADLAEHEEQRRAAPSRRPPRPSGRRTAAR